MMSCWVSVEPRTTGEEMLPAKSMTPVPERMGLDPYDSAAPAGVPKNQYVCSRAQTNPDLYPVRFVCFARTLLRTVPYS